MSKSSKTTSFVLANLNNTILSSLQKVGGTKQIKYLDMLFSNTDEIIVKLNNNLTNLIKSLDPKYSDNSIPTLLAAKLSELPEVTIQQIVNKESFIELISNIKNYGSESVLGLILEKSGLKLELKDLSKISAVKNGYCLSLIKYVSNPLIMDLTEPQATDNSLIQNLFSKIYYLEHNASQRTNFASELKQALERVIQEPVIYEILENACTNQGEIFFTGHDLNGSAKASYIMKSNNILSRDMSTMLAFEGNKIAALMNALVHEATHKYINTKFNNQCLPYFKNGEPDQRSKDIMVAIEEEIHCENIFHSKQYFSKITPNENWLLSMASSSSYKGIKDYLIEVLPHFTGHMAQSIAEKKNIAGVSKDFAQILWNYLHKQLLDLENTSSMSDLYYRSIDSEKILNDLPVDITEVFSLLEDNPHNFDLLNFPTGELALQSLPRAFVGKLINELLKSPLGEVNNFLKAHLASLCKINDKWPHGFGSDGLLADELLKLPEEKFESIVRENYASIRKIPSIRIYMKITKLFPDGLEKIAENNTIIEENNNTQGNDLELLGDHQNNEDV